ncbi:MULTISPECIES: hypothetical protein [Stenotrophomonas]|jgi:hypothetical protein|uniref:hypothetical protein n=1 Tax=Stenotrophomonas TaxID=40323 RepID=UPI0015DE6057|nr:MULTISPECIES: hypothetical protein [Stenotrophomonas]MBA0352027.1 hypothetical protein [Stenotrophomonas maltophilia]MDH0549605.1 hypothetical protein [Stenotrophomonas sp. GD04006]
MEAKTYTNRTNARRAGVAAGVPSELVEITVHKNGDEVRFGWKQKDAPAAEPAPVVATSKPKKAAAPKVQQEERNGVKRPKDGGACAAVWAWLDAHPGATVKDVREAAPEHGWNASNCQIEFYAWRKFNGISGRTKAAA